MKRIIAKVDVLKKGDESRERKRSKRLQDCGRLGKVWGLIET